MTATPKSRKPRSRKPSHPSEIEACIRQRAYQLYEQRSKVGALDDWLQAEIEILGAQREPKVRAVKRS